MEQSTSSQSRIGKYFIFLWISITLVYSFLYMKYLDDGQAPVSIGSHTAGFFGLFTPIGPLSLLLFPVSNLIALLLIYTAIKLGNKIPLNLFTKTLYILGALLLITIVVDFFRGLPFESWNIFLDGKMQLL